MEGDYAPGTHLTGDEPKGSSRVAHIHQDESTDSGVKELGVNGACVLFAEGNVGDSPRGPPFIRKANCIAVKIDPYDGAPWADDLAQEETDVTRTAADVQHIHARSNSGGAKNSFSKGPNQLGLLDQPVVFGHRPAKRIVGVVH